MPVLASKEPVRDLQNKSKRTPHSFADNGNLFNMFRDTPPAGYSRRKEHDIARPESMFHARFVDHVCLAGKEMDGFVLAVMPLEGSGRAIPNNNGGVPVAARQKFIDTSLRRAIQDPVFGNRIGLKAYCIW